MWKTILMWEVVVASAHGQGPCRLFHDLMPDFNLDHYTGVWYPLLGWSNSVEGNVRGKCSKETITHQDGNITIFEESMSPSGTRTSTHHAWQDAPRESKITMWMFHAIKVPFWIVDTDYKHWAVVYSCIGHDESEYLKTLLVLGRKRDFAKLWQNPEAKRNIRRSLRRSSLLRLKDLTTIDQDDCSN